MKKDPAIYLEHILEAMQAILRFTDGVEEEAFYQDDLIQSAVIRKFEIMGEAAKRIPDGLRAAHPDNKQPATTNRHPWFPPFSQRRCPITHSQ